MPRSKQQRKVMEPPHFSGYRPYGTAGGPREPMELFYEEYEALKLTDYQQMNHQEACRSMGISRATFARIYDSARKKIAYALVEAREIKTGPGHAFFEDAWYRCYDCNARFCLRDLARRKHCPTCQSHDYGLIT